jgi:uncharacterized protein
MRYEFPSFDDFRDRQGELQQLSRWWDDPKQWRAMALYGRRRTGKSWLVRAFAHGKEADIFVADNRSERDQLARFADQMRPELGFRPYLPDAGEFLKLLFQRAGRERRLAVIDEFPVLWQANRDLPGIMLRVFEEEALSSRLKLVICGSHIAMMDELFAERSPLFDRTIPLPVHPFDFSEAAAFLGDFPALEAVERYSVAGGMGRYLTDFSEPQPLEALVIDRVLNPRGPLFNEPRTVLAQELVTPHNYFSILAALAGGAASWGDLLSRSGVERNSFGKYLTTLIDLRIAGSRQPVTETHRDVRRRHYYIRDGFLRFWFRFVFPFQNELEDRLDPTGLYRSELAPRLPDFVAPVFEEIARAWVRRQASQGVRRVGAWWGPALHALRRAGARTSEEIDVVAMSGRAVTLVGECRWRADPMDVMILKELHDFKLPALAQVPGLTIAPDCRTVLFSRAGFTKGLEETAARQGIQLVTAGEAVAGLRPGGSGAG